MGAAFGGTVATCGCDWGEVDLTSRLWRSRWFGALAVTCTVGTVLATNPVHASGDWKPSGWVQEYPEGYSYGGYLTDYFPLGLRMKQPSAPGAKKWEEIAEARFRGKRLGRAWRTFPDGTVARVRGNMLRLRKPGQIYLTQIPIFRDQTISWAAVDYRRPLPITGSLRVVYDVFEKTTGRRGQWDCSVYYHDVCRWKPGRQGVPKHRVAGAITRARIFTEIGPDRLRRPGWDQDDIGYWCKPVTDIPQDILNNPLYPTSTEESWDHDCADYSRPFDVFGSGGLNNEATLDWNASWRYTK